MKLLLRGAVFTGACALLFGVSIALSSLGTVSGASQIKPDKTKISCAKSTACFQAINTYTGYGVEGVSNSGVGIYGESTNGFGLYAVVLANDALPIEAVNAYSGGGFFVDGSGNGYFTGNVYTNYAVVHNARTRDGGHERTFGTQSTRETVEDTGTARLVGGEAAVRFDSAFANTIDTSRGYQVFLTPNGETRGWLYVSAKYQGGFIVREAEHGRSSVDFDYRIVAHPFGVNDDRLPRLSIKLPTPMVLHRPSL